MRLDARIEQVCGEDQSLDGRWNDRVFPFPSGVSAAEIAIESDHHRLITLRSIWCENSR